MMYRSFALATVVVLASTSMLLAQRPTSDNPNQTNRDPARTGAQNRQVGESPNARLTGEIAAWLALGNQGEIESSKFALDKANNPDVRQFAQRMIDDHGTYLKQLQQFMPALGTAQRTDTFTGTDNNNPANANRNGAGNRAGNDANRNNPNRVAADPNNPNRVAANGNNAAGNPAQRGNRMHSPMLGIAQQAAANEVALNKKLLENYQGADFDMAYLGQQIGAHTQMLAVLHAVKNVGDENFQKAVADGIQTTEEHIALAQQISHKIEGELRGPQAGQQGTQPRIPQNGTQQRPTPPRSE